MFWLNSKGVFEIVFFKIAWKISYCSNVRREQMHKYKIYCFLLRLAGSEEARDDGRWKLYFKLYCFLDVESMPKEGVEFAFMFEQVCQSDHIVFYRDVLHYFIFNKNVIFFLYLLTFLSGP